MTEPWKGVEAEAADYMHHDHPSDAAFDALEALIRRAIAHGEERMRERAAALGESTADLWRQADIDQPDATWALEAYAAKIRALPAGEGEG